MPQPPEADAPEEILIILDGPVTLAKSHIAETLQDLLLHMGFQVAADPLHGFTSPAALRMKSAVMPPIRIVEFEQTLDMLNAVEGEG